MINIKKYTSKLKSVQILKNIFIGMSYSLFILNDIFKWKVKIKFRELPFTMVIGLILGFFILGLILYIIGHFTWGYYLHPH